MRADDELTQARILVVDDQEANVRLLERILERAGYTNVATTTDSRQVLGLIEAPLILTPWMQRHRHDHAGIAQQVGAPLSHQRTQAR